MRLDTQALMDTALNQAPEDVKTRFIQAIGSSEKQVQPAGRASPRTTIAADDVMSAAATGITTI